MTPRQLLMVLTLYKHYVTLTNAENKLAIVRYFHAIKNNRRECRRYITENKLYFDCVVEVCIRDCTRYCDDCRRSFGHCLSHDSLAPVKNTQQRYDPLPHCGRETK